MTHPNPEPITLGIAHLSIQLHCPQPALAESLRTRYRSFAPQTQANFSAQIHWVGKERQNALLETGLRFENGGLTFEAPHYKGFINLQQNRGELTFSSAQPVEEVDYYLRVVFALLAHNARGVLLHSAGLTRGGQAYLFFGHSGSGKTTVCRVSTAAQVLNDDLILLLPNPAGGWQAYGTPFWNPTQVQPSAQNAPVAGLYLLRQAKHVQAQPLSTGRALAALIANAPIISQDPARSAALLDILLQIERSLPVYELHFLPDASFWDVILTP